MLFVCCPSLLPSSYTHPSQLSSPGGEDGEGRQDTSTATPTTTTTDHQTCHHHHHYEPRHFTQHHHHHQQHDSDNTSKLQGRGEDDNNNNNNKTQLTRLDDTLHIRGPRQEEKHITHPLQTSPSSPTRKTTIHPELNGAQNGSNAIPLSPPPLENGTVDTVKSLDSVPWNLEGIETIKENGCRLREWSLSSASDDHHTLSDEDELSQLRDENKRLKAALKEVR